MSIVLAALSPLASAATQLLSNASFDATVIVFGIGVPFLMSRLSFKFFRKSVDQSIDVGQNIHYFHLNGENARRNARWRKWQTGD